MNAAKLLANAEIARKGCAFKSEAINKLAFGSYNNGFKNPRTPCDWLSRDNAVVDSYYDDPMCGYIPSVGMFRDMVEGILFNSNPRNVQRMNKSLPVYFISGDKDPVGDNGKGVIKAYQSFLSAGMEDVTVKLYPGARHELVNELNKDEVFEDVLGWLYSKI